MSESPTASLGIRDAAYYEGYTQAKLDAVDRCLIEKGSVIGCNPANVIDRCVDAIAVLDWRHTKGIKK
jgi:hypothetical protein